MGNKGIYRPTNDRPVFVLPKLDINQRGYHQSELPEILVKNQPNKIFVSIKDLNSGETIHWCVPQSVVNKIEQITKDEGLTEANDKIVVTKKPDGDYDIKVVKLVIMTRQQIKKTLKEKFPSAVFRNGYDLNPEFKEHLWFGDECYNEEGELLFDIVGYADGIHSELKEILNENGWHCEVMGTDKVLICKNL